MQDRRCVGSWKTKRHDALIGILFRLGVASGLRKGDHIQTEVRDLYTAKRPSDILVRRPREERAAGEEAAFLFNHDGGGASPSTTRTAASATPPTTPPLQLRRQKHWANSASVLRRTDLAPN